MIKDDAIPAIDEKRDAMFDGPLGFPVGHIRILLGVEAERRRTFRVLEQVES